MATLRTVIIDTDAVATSSNYYTGLAEAELAIRTANETDLVSRDEYIEFRCTGSAVDTDNVTFDSSSWVTSEDNYIAIIANDNHNGQWNENIYRLIPSTPPQHSSLRLTGVNFVRVIGLQIRGGHLDRSGRGAISIDNTRHGYAKIHRNYILADSASLSYVSTGLSYYLGNAPGSQSIEITSNIFDGWINTLDTNGQGPSGSRGVGMDLQQYATRFVYNNTFINCSTGSRANEVASTTYFENNLAYGNNLDFVFGGTLGGSNDYNASGDSTAIGSNSLTNISNPFVDYAGGDYSLRTQSPLLDAGNYQSASLEDVRGKTRVGTWDIGAFEKFLWTRAKPSPELVVNGGFDTDSGYTKDTGWTISDGKLRATSAGNTTAAFQTRLVEIGETVMVTFTVDSISEGAVGAFVGGSSNVGTTRTAPGTYREIFVAGASNTTGLVASGTTTCVIDNFSVKKVKTIAKPSTELITNGGFDTDTDWTKQGTTPGWSIAGGVASADNDTNADLVQDIGAIPGNTYRVTYTILNYVKGNVAAVVGGTGGGQTPANGTYVKDIIAGSANSNFLIRGGSDHQFDVDNVSVKEVKALIK